MPNLFKHEDKASKKPEDMQKEPIEGSGACAADVEDNRDRHTEKALDHGLKETFPASAPVSINPGAD
jgi:hypothetical protein